MSIPAFFIYPYYMNEKLKQLQRDEPDTWCNATVSDVSTAFVKNGYVGEDGAYQHFISYGAKEGVDPNPHFCAEAYYTFRATKQGWHVSDVTVTRHSQVKRDILAQYGSAWAEYLASGMLEFTNASNAFDTKGYLEAKLRQLRDTDPANWGTKTVADLAIHMQAEGLNPVMHYYLFGVAEGIPVTAVPESDQVYVTPNLKWDARESLLKNKVFQLTDWERINNINLPKYIDVLLQVSPSCVEDEQSGYGIQFNDALVDLQTGTVTEFLLHPRAMQIGTIPLKSFTRKQYNTILDFTFFVEGRYLGYWTSLCNAAYRPIMYAEPYFPSIEDMEYMFGQSPDGNRTYFYALNWGQAELFDTTKNRILAIYTDGYKNCYWCKPMHITVMDDPRIVRVDVREPLPRIELHQIDVITEYMYVHSKVDELPISFITNAIVVGTLEIQEDVDYTYDPWLEIPPAYPDVAAEVGDGIPADDKTAPMLLTTTPAQGATNINTTTTLILTFNEPVRAGAGEFVLSGPSGKQTYTASSPYVMFSGSSVVITLHTELSPLTEYSFYGGALAVSDLSGNYWPGNSANPIKFQTAQENIIDTEPPKLLSSVPANADVNVSPATDVKLVFSEKILAGSGFVVLSTDDNDGDGYADHTVTLPASSGLIANSEVSLALTELLHRNTEYYVTITSTAFKDSWGNFYPGFSDISTLRFRTSDPKLIWYIPDIDRGKSAEEFVKLQELYGARMRWLEWWPMDSFKSNWSDLQEATVDAQAKDLFVGSGMGAFFAARAADKYKATAYLINPVINPAIQLAHTVGPHVNHDGTQYSLTIGLLNGYSEATDPRTSHMRNRFNLCVGTGDDVVDYTVSESYYPPYREYWYDPDPYRSDDDRWVVEGWARIRRRLTGAPHIVSDTESLELIVADIRSLGF